MTHSHDLEARKETTRGCCCAKAASAAASAGGTDPKQIDPVCGMSVSSNSTQVTEHAGHRYVFCSAGCRAKFIDAPERYVDAKGVRVGSAAGASGHGVHAPATAQPEARSTASDPAPGAMYTCPMHPQIRQVGPGSCPICGMALEPVMPTDAADDGELRIVR
ncbi:MAG: heavy metal-binding domain-containing protein, partial [Gammaproteobacteria bacterium]